MPLARSLLRALLAAALAVLTSAADELLPPNVTLTFPIAAAGWRDAVKQTSAVLGGRVGALLVFARPSDSASVGPLVGSVAAELGAESPLFILFVGDADDGTLGDDTLGGTLPHVLLMLPKRDADPRGPPALRPHAAWSSWPPNADLKTNREARREATTGVVNMVRPALDDCAEDGLCDEVMDADKFKEAHRRLHEDVRAQTGGQQRKGRMIKHEVKLNEGRAEMSEGKVGYKRKRKRGEKQALQPEDPTKQEL